MIDDAPILRIDRAALMTNWRALNSLSNGKAGAVVKANGYGLGIEIVAPTLWAAGARVFFVATFAEARELARLLPDAQIYELSGQSAGQDVPANIIPVVNNAEQLARINSAFGLQFDTGLSRLGFDPAALGALGDLQPLLVMSHLASADDPDHPQNRSQLGRFAGIRTAFPKAQASLAATGGILLGHDYQFDITRPGIGIYGGAPFFDAKPVLNIEFPLLNTREIKRGSAVGYGASFIARAPMRVATVLGGYADGISRAMNAASLFAGDTPCPILGRISMDAITVDISALESVPDRLALFGPGQDLNALAETGGTIAYELLVGLGFRYKRVVE